MQRLFDIVVSASKKKGVSARLLALGSGHEQINGLERGLGVQILKRSNRFVGLATLGEIFSNALGGLSIVSIESKQCSPTSQKPDRYTYRSVLPALFYHSLFPYVLGAFKKRFPGIALSVITADPDSMAARLAHRELDLALLPFAAKQQSLGMVLLGHGRTSGDCRSYPPPCALRAIGRERIERKTADYS
jgi:DNA-binding transcriptional LysR family regulator